MTHEQAPAARTRRARQRLCFESWHVLRLVTAFFEINLEGRGAQVVILALTIVIVLNTRMT